MQTNKGADLLGHPHSLISAFVFRCLDSTVPTLDSYLVISEVSRLLLASRAEQAGLSLTGSHKSEDMFSNDETHIWF